MRLLPLLALLGASAAWAGNVSVVIAAVDLPAGAKITQETLAQRKVPAAVVTSSVVKAGDASYLVDQRLLAPVLAGDLMLWSFFETKPARAACEQKMATPKGAQAQIARHRAVALHRR